MLGALGGGASALNFTSLRAVRVLKLLRTMSAHRSLQVTVETLCDAILGMLQLGALIAFLFFVLGLAGTQLFRGSLRQRCEPLAVPASSVVTASTRSSHAKPWLPVWWAIVSAIEIACSIIAGE